MGNMAQAAQASMIAEDARRADPRRWFALGVVLSGAFLVMVAVSVVNLAIPSIRQTLHAGFGDIQLVIAVYTLVYATFLIAGGRLGDLLGRKRVLLAGVALFTLGAAAGGLAPSTAALVAARVVQGLGSALMYPQFLTIIQDAFDDRERGLALGAFGAMIGVGVVMGQLLGGAVISLDIAGQSWRPAFLLLVPIGAATLVAASTVLENRPSQAPQRLDVPGVVSFGVAVTLLLLPLLVGRQAGWPPWTFAALAASVPAFALFLWYERRRAGRGRAPLLDPALFRQRGFVVGCLMGIAFMSTIAGFLLVLPVTLQLGLGYAPAAVGVAQAPLGIAFFAASLLAPRLVNALGRYTMAIGFAVLVLGLLTTLAVVREQSGTLSLWSLAPGLVVMGLGQGLGMAPLIGTVLASVRRQDIGAVAGALPTSFQIGQVLGIALIGLGFFQALAAQPASAAAPQRYLAAFAADLPFVIAAVLLCLVLVFALPRPAGQGDNVLLERVPDRLVGLVYSLYFTTGGHVGSRALADLVAHAIGHRTARVEEAPVPPGAFLVHHFERSDEDVSWYRYLVEEALALGAGPIPFEESRLPVISLQVDEVRRRQAEGVIDPEFDPAALRLLGFALTSYPRLLPQVARMTTGHAPGSAEFHELWARLLLQIGARLEPPTNQEG